MTKTSSSCRLSKLRLSSALASVLACAALAPVAHAQTLPSVSNAGGAGVTTNGAGDQMTVDLNNANRIVEWNSFSTSADAKVTFQTADTTLPYTVLNRVVGASASQIDGEIAGQNNVSVWLVNGNGIAFGPTGKYSGGGSLVLSTLDLRDVLVPGDADTLFLAGLTARSVAGTSANVITLDPGSSIISSGSVLAIAQKIAANGSINATGDVAIVAASDVTLPASLNSPLSFTINEGTTLAAIDNPGASVGGSVTGTSVKLVGASQGGAIANLLRVDVGGSLTANAANGVVVIGTRTAGDVTMNNSAAVDGIVSAGTLTTQTGATDVIITGTGAVSQAGAVTAVRDYSISSASGNVTQGDGAVIVGRDALATGNAGVVTVQGAVTAGRDYIGRGNSIALGGAGSVTQQAAGTADMKAATGITATAGLTLTSNSDGVGTEALILDTNGTLGLAAGSTFNGGPAKQSLVGINFNAGFAQQLGNFNALGLGRVDPGDHSSITSSVATLAGLTIGDVNVTNALDLSSTGTLTAGALAVTGAGQGITLTVNGAANDLVLTSATTTDGTIQATAGRDIIGPSSTGAVFTAGGTTRNLTLGPGRDARLGAIKAGNNVTVTANGTVNVTTGEATAGDLVYDLAANSPLTLGNQTAGKSIAIRTTGTGSVTAQGGGASFTAGEDIAIRAGSGGVTLTGLTADDDVDVTSTGLISLATFNARNSGANVDARAIDFSGVTVAFTGAEATDRIGANAVLSNRGGTGDLTVATSGAAAADILLDTSGAASLALQNAGRSLAVRSVNGITGTTLQAGEDLAFSTGSGGVVATRLQAGDDIDVATTGVITLDTFDAQGLGANIDARRIDLTGGSIAFAAESADRTGANARLSNRTGIGALTISTSGRAARDIVLDTNGAANVAQQTAVAGSLAIRSPGAITGTTLLAGEDIAARAGTTLTLDSAQAVDDLTLNAAGRLELKAGGTTAAGTLDARNIDMTGGTIVFTAGDAGSVGANLSAISTGGDVVASTTTALSANGSALLRSDTANVRVRGVTALTNTATVTAALDVTGLAGASTGTSDTGFGRGNITGNGNPGGDSVTVTAGGLVQLGSVTAQNGMLITAGNGASNGAIDLTSATTNTAPSVLALSARASAPIDTIRDGDIIVGTVTAAGTVQIGNQLGIAGNIDVRDHVTAVGTATLNSANDIRVAEYSSATPTTGFVRSTGGNVSLTAAKSIYGLAGTATMVADRGISSIDAGGALTLNATGDVRMDQIAAGSINATIGGSLTGAGGATGTAVTGGALFANATGGTITVNAGAAANVARFNTVSANSDVSITAGNIAVGTLSSTAGTVTLNGSTTLSDTNLYIGSITVPGALNVSLGGVPTLVSPISSGDLFDPGFGRTTLNARAGALSATVSGVAQIDTASATSSVAITASGLGVRTANAGTTLGLSATTGTLQLGTGTAGTSATISKTGGSAVTANDELRIVTGLTANGGDATVTSSTHARINQVTATGGSISATAATGNVTGLLASTPLALVPTYGRGNLTALSVDRTITASAVAGTVQLGTVAAGAGTTTSAVATNQVNLTGLAVDVTTATASNSSLNVEATGGEARIGTGTGRVDAITKASTSLRIGSLTAQTGDAGATAIGGDFTGLPSVQAPAGGDTFTTGSVLVSQASAANLEATIGSVTATANNGVAQLNTVTAGTNITGSAQALVANTANAGQTLGLTATAGTLAVGTGTGTTVNLTKQGGTIGTAGDELRVTTLASSGTGGTTILSNTHARVFDARSAGGNVSVTTTLGDVTGLAIAPLGDTRLVSDFDRADLRATQADGRVLVNAGRTAQLGTVSAGAGGIANAALLNQIDVQAQAIDVSNATADNGTLVLNASTGDARLGTGLARINANIDASQSVRIDDLTAQTGNVRATAANGDVTGLPTVQAPALGSIISTGSILATQAGAAKLAASAVTGSVTVGADNGIAQLNTVTAGANITGSAQALVANTANAGQTLGLTATAGTLAIGTGTGTTVNLTKQGGAIGTSGDELRVTTQASSGTGGTTILSNTHARLLDARSAGGNVSVTTTLGDVTGLATSPTSDTRLVSDFNRADLRATQADGRVIVNAARTAQLGIVAAGAGGAANTALPNQIDVQAQAIDASNATADNGTLVFNASNGDARLGTGVARVDAIISASQSARIGSLTAQTRNLRVAATNGDITGLPTVQAPAAGTLVTTGTVLAAQAGAANLTATAGSVTFNANNGIAQLQSVTAGTSIGTLAGGSARAIVVDTATAGTTLDLTATAGTLALGTGSAGTSATLIKQGGSLTTAGDELRVATSLTAGAVNGSSGGATLTSSTHIRVPTVEARGGSITLNAVDGEVTGIAGGRADLTAALARDALGVGIAGTDRSIDVTSGLVSRLGTLSAGDNIAVLAGSVGGAARDGAIDLIEATTTRGDLTLDVYNDDAARANGILVTRTVNAGLTRNVGGTASFRTQGSNGGAITVSDRVDANGDVVARSVTDTSLLHARAGRTIAVNAGGSATGNDYTAGTDIGVVANGAVNIGALEAGDDIDLRGSTITITSARATGSGPDNSAVDFSLSPSPIAPAELASRARANVTMNATGAITVNGDVSAQRNVTVDAGGKATMIGNVTAGAPLAGVVIDGDYSVRGTDVELGTSAARTQQASGALSVTATTGNITQGSGRLTLTSNSNALLTEALSLNAARDITLANSALIGGSIAGRQSEVRVNATGGTVTLAKVDGQALNVRAGTGITVLEAIDAGNAVRLADPVAGGSTVDLSTTAGGISLTTATTYGADHDIVLAAPGLVTAATLNATRDIKATSSANDVVVTTLAKAGRDITIDAGRHSRTLEIDGGRAVSVTARNGDATGMVGASTGTSDLTAGGAKVTAGATLGVTATGLIQLGAAQAGTGLTLTAGSAASNGAIDATSLKTTAGNLLASARAASSADPVRDGDIRVGEANAGGNLTLTNVASLVGDIVVGTRADAGAAGVFLIDSARDAFLPLGWAGGAGTIRAVRNATANDFTAGGTATLAAGAAANSATLFKSSGADVAVSGATVSLNTADATTALVATARTGDLTLATGLAGTTASLTTASIGTGDVIVSTSLNSGQAATITSVSDARLASVKATTGDVKVTALNGEVTGIGTGNANLEATAGAVQVDAGTLIRLGTVKAGTTLTATGTGLVQVGTGQAGTGLTLTAGTVASNGAIDATSLKTTAGNLTLTARAASSADAARDGDIRVGDATAGGNLTLTNVAGTSGDIVVGTRADAGAAGVFLIDSARDATLPLGTAGGAGTVRAVRNASAGSLTVGGTATLSAGATATSATLIKSNTANVAIDGTTVTLNNVEAGTALVATARTGDLSLVTGTVGTTASLTTATGGTGDVIVSTSLNSGQAATITSVRNARLANVKAATGGLTVTALAGEVTGIGTGNANLEATAGAVKVDGGTLTRLGTVKSGTTLAVTSDTIVTGALTSGTTASLIADTGALTIASATSGGDVTLATPGLATLGAITATGRKVTLTSADAAIDGNVAAQRIEVLNKSASNTLRLGEGAAGSGGFELTETEVNRLNAAEVQIDAGTATGATAQNIAVGKLALDADSGSAKFDLLGTQRIDMTGAFTATGSTATRAIRLGGSAVDSARATVLRIAATATAGGRINVGEASLELRGSKIGVGQDAAFLQAIGLLAGGTPLDAQAVATRYVGNANSSLYNAQIGGVPYATDSNGQPPALVATRSLTMRFSDYALIQNTAGAGRSGGVTLGGTVAAPVIQALRLIGPNPPDAGAVALFGSVNGSIETATALLGPSVIELTAINRANARINGCVIGAAGGGCIANLVTQPVLGVFDSSKAAVFRTATDFELPFDPVVGTNNESLFGDVGTFGLSDLPLGALPNCPPDDQTCNATTAPANTQTKKDPQ